MLPPKAWQPESLTVLDAVANLGYDGISLGPPGYLGEKKELSERLATRGLCLAEAFLPLHFARDDLFPQERTGLRATLSLLLEVTNVAERPLAVLSDGFREPTRWGAAGRIVSRPDTWMPPRLLPTLLSNLHRAAEDCLNAGFTPVLHHHAGTLIETNYELRRVFDSIDPSLLGMCLDTAHAVLGHADPVELVRDYHSLIRDVHVKDLSLDIVAASHTKDQNLTDLTADGAFTPLGKGDAPIAKVLAALKLHDYQGWLVIEQDRFLFGHNRFEEVVDDQRHNIAFVKQLLSRCESGRKSALDQSAEDDASRRGTHHAEVRDDPTRQP